MPELNFTARLDTSQFLSQIDQARTQFGLAFGPMGLGPGPGGVGGMVSSQFQQMFLGLQAPALGGSGFGQTFTNPAIAYSPFYGAAQATTSLEQEWLVNRYGLAAAERMKPPGVSASDYALGVEKNYINRQLEATHEANMAARAGFMSGVGGLVGGELGSAIATPLGAMAGGAIASRLFGAGAAGAGKMLGGLAAGWYAYDAASNFVSDKIDQHYAQIEQIGGITRELGEIVGGGRGMKRGERYELGVAARQAAKDLNMDVNEMGDILSLGRNSGMLPTTNDPNSAREKFRDFARAIEEGSQILNTSLANATQIVKTATAGGMTAQEGIIRAAGTIGGPEAWLQQQAFAASGIGVARGMGFAGWQGYGIFSGALGAVGTGGLSGLGGGAGMNGEEIQILGGHYAAAQFLGSTQLAMAKSPLGNAQLMAAMGGQALGGMMDLPGAAMSGLMAGGGDFLSNAGKFMIHQNEMRRGIGASGVRTMARSQLVMGGDMIQQLMPDLSAEEAQRMYAQSMGLDPDQAKLLVRGTARSTGGGVGMGSAGQMQAIAAMQGTMLGVSGPGLSPGHHGSFGFGRAIEFGVTGATLGGGVPGAIAGAAVGFVSENWGHLRELGSDILSGDIFRSAADVADRDQRRLAAEYDQRLGAAKARMGYLDIDPMAGQRFLNSDLRGARLNLDAAGSPIASSRTYGMMAAMGIGGAAAGPGTVKMAGGYVSATDMQALGRGKLWDTPVTDKDMEATMSLAHSVGYGSNLDEKRFQEYSLQVRMNWQTVLHGETPKGMFGTNVVGVVNAGENLIPSVRRLIQAGEPGAVRDRLLSKLNAPGGVNDPEIRAFLKQTTGSDFDSLGGAFMAGRGGAAAMKAAEMADMNDEASWLFNTYAPREISSRARSTSVSPFASSGSKMWDDFMQKQQHDKNEGALDEASRRNHTMPASFYKELQSNRHYLEAKEAVLAGHNDEARRMLQKAEMETQVAGGDKYRTATLPVIDPTARVQRPGAGEGASIMFTVAQTLRNVTAAAGGSSSGPTTAHAAISRIEAAATAQASEMTTWAQEVKNEKATAMAEQHKARLRSIGAGTMSHAIGFGEQESAMSSINRSLKSTERSLSSIEKKIAGLNASPQQSSTPQIPTGGKL